MLGTHILLRFYDLSSRTAETLKGGDGQELIYGSSRQEFPDMRAEDPTTSEPYSLFAMLAVLPC